MELSIQEDGFSLAVSSEGESLDDRLTDVGNVLDIAGVTLHRSNTREVQVLLDMGAVVKVSMVSW